MAEEKEQEAPKKKKKGLIKWIILAVLILGLAGGGYFAYTKFFAKPKADHGTEAPAKEAEHGAEKAGEAKGYKDLVTLPTFVVNLADPLGRRYLKLSVDVEVTDEKTAQELKAMQPQVQDAVILLLSSKTFQDLQTIESKILLKKQIVDRLNQVLGGPKVLRVFFTDMVVQ
ncbi:flagellar basal body-associated protein FliL [Desulfovibrio sp. X2]|uniref:flagellar basal body-associated FliL family protein n=1 Tax=Desulfovibrio sp. X2 TaxID=941449 RepID=UPI000358C57C|nr:flagellar basal body-associated protein FliL [Desulfovibrio sp. X2]EPR44029.1 flagellar basal body-associated protein FliL [Desulfovibrio sp. X2]